VSHPDVVARQPNVWGESDAIRDLPWREQGCGRVRWIFVIIEAPETGNASLIRIVE
jgi:hypothetical protein